MAKKNYPKKGLGSYLLPFILIFILIGSGWYIIQNNLNVDDLIRVFRAPEVAKDEKVQISYQEGDNKRKAWSAEEWEVLNNDTYLQAGDAIKTSKSGLVILKFFENSEIRIDSNSQVKLIQLDKDNEGNHLALELISGRLWRRGPAGNTGEADFIINTTHQIIQLNQASLVDVSTNPEGIRVIGGEVIINIAKKVNGARKPISRLSLVAGEQVQLDDLVIDELKAGERDVVTGIDGSYFKSEWYLWNLEIEKKLGYLVEPTVEATEREALPALDEGLVTVTTPKEEETVGSKILVQGTYDSTAIEKIWVNGEAATLGLSDEWEAPVSLGEQANSITVTALEADSEEKKEAISFTVDVDTTGPGIGTVTQPAVDDNDNGVIAGDKLELIGKVSDDTARVCVDHNDAGEPYCLKQFKKGDATYRYLGGVVYGNVVSGKNKYTIQAYDSLGNVTEKNIYLFKDEPKPTEKIEEEPKKVSEKKPESEPTSSGSELPRPLITSPDPSSLYETSDQMITVSGTVDPRSRSLLVNEKKANYKAGADTFSFEYKLSEGENLIKVQAVDTQGNKSKTALLKVMYLEGLGGSSEETEQ